MNTIALKGKVLKQNNRGLALKKRIIREITTYFEKYGVEIACGMLMLIGNTSAVLTYPMLKK